MIYVENMLSPNSGREVANQFIIEDDNNIYFQSYKTVIAKISKNSKEVTLSSSWDYSRTTGKYRNQFMDMYCTKYNNKKAIERGIKAEEILVVDEL